MKIKSKPIAVASLAAVCAATLVAGAGMLGKKTAYAADDQTEITATSYFGDNLTLTVNGSQTEYALAKKFYNALDEMCKAGDFTDGKVQYNITEKGVVTSQQIQAWIENSDLTVPKAFSAARDAFLTDHPELFYIDFYKLTISAAKSGNAYTAYIDSGREANVYYDNGFTTEAAVSAAITKFDAKVDEITKKALAAQAKDTYSEKDAFLARYVNSELAGSIKYDYVTYQNKDDENYIAAANVSTAYGGLVEGKAVCSGFSTAYKVIMDKLGVPCITVNGYSNQKNEYGEDQPSSVYHMWNYVYLEVPSTAKSAASTRAATAGDWYSVDVTWNSASLNRNKYAVLQKSSDEKIHVTDGVISSARYELKYPELSSHNYGASGETNGLQASFVYKDSGEGKDDFGNTLMDTFVTVSYNGKSANRLLREDELYLVYRSAVYSDSKLVWSKWTALAPTMEYMSIVATIDGYMEDTGTETIFYENTSIYYMQFGVFDAVPDVETMPIYNPDSEHHGKTFAISYTDAHLNESKAVDVGEAMVNETYGTYTPAPYVQSTTPNHQSEIIISDGMRDGSVKDKVLMSEGSALVFEITYDEPLHVLDETKPITVSFTSEHPNAQEYARFFPLSKDSKGNDVYVEIVERPKSSADSTLVKNTLRFKFGASLMYEHNREGYHFFFGNVGSAKPVTRMVNGKPVEETSDKAPNPAYYSFGRLYMACPARFNYDGRLWVECCAQPVLADNSDLSATNFLKEDGTTSFSENERSQMMLVAEKIDETTETTMKNEILGGDSVVSEEELSKSETYDIKLQICGKYPKIPDGSYVKIALGFPEGYGPDDEGVRFKLYHRKHLGGDNYIIEEIPCVVTQFGIVATVKSFSPYMVVPVAANKVSDKTVYATVDGKGGKLNADDGQIRSLNDGESYTYTIKPDAGYAIYSVTLNGKNVTEQVKDGKLTVKYADLAADNEIEIRYISDDAAARYEELDIVDPPKVFVTVTDGFHGGDITGATEAPPNNSNVVMIVVIVVAVVVIVGLAAVAITLIVKKKSND